MNGFETLVARPWVQYLTLCAIMALICFAMGAAA